MRDAAFERFDTCRRECRYLLKEKRDIPNTSDHREELRVAGEHDPRTRIWFVCCSVCQCKHLAMDCRLFTYLSGRNALSACGIVKKNREHVWKEKRRNEKTLFSLLRRHTYDAKVRVDKIR
jgi:hypothetical protein